MRSPRLLALATSLLLALASRSSHAAQPTAKPAAPAAPAAPAPTAPVSPGAPPAARARSFAVQVTGHGKPMILIPGLTCGGDVWKSTVEHFKDQYECHVLTLAGFAGQPAIGAPMLETVRKDIAAYIRSKNLVRPVIVGHSLGGFLAFWMGATEPNLVGPIISVDGGTFFPALMNPDATVESAKAAAESIRQAMENQTREQFAAQNKMFLGGQITDPKNVEMIAPICGKSDPKAVGLALYELMTTDLRAEVAKIKSPVLLIGAVGAVTAPEMKKGMTARYVEQVAKAPNHKVIMAEKARHFVMLDDPQFLFSAIDDFLRTAQGK